MVCSLDMFIQGCLLKIGVSDGELTKEELFFLSALPDEFDEVCARNRGYRRFIKLITIESYKADWSKFYDYYKTPLFLETLMQDFDEAPMMVRSNLQIIFNAFIAIDGIFSESEADVALEILNKIDDGTTEYPLKKDDMMDEPEKSDTSQSDGSESESNTKPYINIDDINIQSCLD